MGDEVVRWPMDDWIPTPKLRYTLRIVDDAVSHFPLSAISLLE